MLLHRVMIGLGVGKGKGRGAMVIKVRQIRAEWSAWDLRNERPGKERSFHDVHCREKQGLSCILLS